MPLANTFLHQPDCQCINQILFNRYQATNNGRKWS